jgi:hypothetical protein
MKKLIIAIICLIIVSGCKRKTYKYHIYDVNHSYYTNSIKETEGCVSFYAEDVGTTRSHLGYKKICGNYTID